MDHLWPHHFVFALWYHVGIRDSLGTIKWYGHGGRDTGSVSIAVGFAGHVEHWIPGTESLFDPPMQWDDGSIQAVEQSSHAAHSRAWYNGMCTAGPKPHTAGPTFWKARFVKLYL